VVVVARLVLGYGELGMGTPNAVQFEMQGRRIAVVSAITSSGTVRRMVS
jgi:hypothetical protein